MQKQKYWKDEVFLVLVVAVIAFLASIYEKEPEKINPEDITGIILKNNGIQLGDNILETKELDELQGMSYKNLKGYLKVSRDFCIYIEDEKGNVLLGKGSYKLNGGGLLCQE